jgi:hypothetical protein
MRVDIGDPRLVFLLPFAGGSFNRQSVKVPTAIGTSPIFKPSKPGGHFDGLKSHLSYSHVAS